MPHWRNVGKPKRNTNSQAIDPAYVFNETVNIYVRDDPNYPNPAYIRNAYMPGGSYFNSTNRGVAGRTLSRSVNTHGFLWSFNPWPTDGA